MPRISLTHCGVMWMLFLLPTGCASAPTAHRPIVVFDMGATIPSNCATLTTVTAADGRFGDDGVSPQNGSRARVLERLKRTAASRGGNALAIRDEPRSICVDCDGSVVQISADVLNCSR